jgi:hypothetical protein
MVTQIQYFNTYLFHTKLLIPKLGSPKLRIETIISFIFLSISTPENQNSRPMFWGGGPRCWKLPD